MKKRVFSGIQPTGVIHIGNYLGAVKNWVASQERFDDIFCIVDLHAITVPQEPAALRAKVRELAGILFAAGIDEQKSALFVQSHVAAHSELAWLLNCIASYGQMQRMTQFKEKSNKQRELVSVGLFAYPTLMAADILLYDSDFVPVGEDQKQHIELTRDLAVRFNGTFGETFTVPAAMIPEVGARIMGLDKPDKKMSKSESGAGHAVGVLDSPDEILAKFRSATTDSGREITFNDDPARAGVNNLLTIYRAFTGQAPAQIEAHFAGKGYRELKQEVAEAVIEGLRPLRERYQQLAADPGQLDALLREGADKVRPCAEKTLRRAQERLGLR
jgi:tryptophanyl-tRNA synthetase